MIAGCFWNFPRCLLAEFRTADESHVIWDVKTPAALLLNKNLTAAEPQCFLTGSEHSASPEQREHALLA